ncbi:SRPBCC family protein [Cryobacterium sp. PH31-L1]|uniref:SRPBCC family protein n=1 Tax=Cryobacterium sp. PH31-L1 TaxID=3046199 RepID=UPI0024BA2F4E|nr:SRPBCC family protein [Cryobacterium sp. PH31-L1]MDJ0377179.1 SRPBCC family protein [Cryobacterium sp. PH31-L1]
MAVNYRRFDCTPEQVFAVLENGWLYPTWVVGASRMRDIDASWPAVGSRIHHSVGIWPALIDDTTSVLEWNAPRHVMLKARGWPMGEAHVSIDIQDHPNGCLVRITEDIVAGPARLVPTPLSDLAIGYRNTETLRRLAYLAEGHAE